MILISSTNECLPNSQKQYLSLIYHHWGYNILMLKISIQYMEQTVQNSRLQISKAIWISKMENNMWKTSTELKLNHRNNSTLLFNWTKNCRLRTKKQKNWTMIGPVHKLQQKQGNSKVQSHDFQIKQTKEEG
jgi:hypothetical protein